MNKRLAVLSAAALAAGGVLATTVATAPAQAAPSPSERAIDGIHHAGTSLVGNVHVKVSNYTDDPIQVITERGEPAKTLNPGESMYDEDGYSAGPYINNNDLKVKTKKGTFEVKTQNGWIFYPSINVINMPGKVGEKFSGGMAVYERWHHKNDGVTYGFWRNPDGSAKMGNTKNFHVIVD